MSPEPDCICTHTKYQHKHNPGFYDVDEQYTKCYAFGCPCRQYVPSIRKPPKIEE